MQNRVTQNDVTLWVTDSIILTDTLLSGYWFDFLKLEIEKYEVPLQATNSIGKLFFHFLVCNSKLKKYKFYFELLIRKAEEQNLDFEVARNFFIEMKYTIHIYLKKI